MIGTTRGRDRVRRAAPVLAVAAVVVLAGAGLLWASGLQAGSPATPGPTALVGIATASVTPTPSPTASPTATPAPTPSPSPPPVAATTDGVWLPASRPPSPRATPSR